MIFCCCVAPFDAPAEADIEHPQVSYLMGLYNMGLVSPMAARFPRFKLVLSPKRVVKIL